MSVLRSCLAVVVAASVLASSSVSFAEPSGDKARELYARAQEAFKKEDYEGARRAYVEAWAIKKSFDIAGNLGNVEMLLKRPRDAAEHLFFALKLFPPTGHPDQKAALEKLLADATKDVGRVRVAATLPDLDRARAAQVRATVNGTPVQATVNGAKVDVAATPENTVLEVAFVEPDKPIVVEAWIDGQGYDGARETGRVKAGEEKTLTTVLAPHGPNTAVLVGGAVVGVSALVAGVVFQVVASGKLSDAAAARDQLAASKAPSCPASGTASASACLQLSDTLSSASTTRNLGTAFLVGGGVALVGTGLYWLLAPRGGGRREVTKAQIQPLPLLGPTQFGAVVRGSF